MQFIYPENQTASPTMTNENANFPATNLATDVVKEYAKSSTTTTIISQPVNADSDGNDRALIAGITADTVKVGVSLDADDETIDNAAATSLDSGNKTGIPITGHGLSQGDYTCFAKTTNFDGWHLLGDQSLGGANVVVLDTAYVAEAFAGTEKVYKLIAQESTYTLSGTIYKQVWHEYTEQTAAHKVHFQLTIASGTVQAGVVRAGKGNSIPNYEYHFKEGRKNFSILDQLDSNVFYTDDSDIVRPYSGKVKFETVAQLESLFEAYEAKKFNPMAFLMNDDDTDERWAVFGFINGNLDAIISYRTYSIMQIDILGVV